MATINRDELLKIAKLSGIHMSDADADLFTGQVQKVLGFIDQLQAVNITQTSASVRNVNLMRDDVAIPTTATSPLDIAPQRQDRYFVVPKILDEK